MPYKDKEKRKAYNENYYRTHRKQILVQHAKYWIEHKNECNIRNSKYRAEHNDELIVYFAKYYIKHKEKRAAYQNKYNVEHKGKRAIYGTKYRKEHENELATYHAEYRVEHREERRAAHYMEKYGLTPDGYNKMLIAQDGVCAICNHPPNGRAHNGKLVVDHDHSTGKVRGLLCSKCNSVLGYVKDSTETLIKAIEYLNKTLAGEQPPAQEE